MGKALRACATSNIVQLISAITAQITTSFFNRLPRLWREQGWRT